MLKAQCLNDCQCNFVDNEEKLIFSFKSSNHQITFLDIRKLQLASMIKGAWCEFREITYYLSFLHQLNSHAVGKVVNFFKLFDFDSENLIDYIPNEIAEVIATISNTDNFSSFFIDSFEKNSIISHPVKEFFSFWKLLERQDIYSISDLIHLTKSEVLELPCIGIKRVYEIEKLLAENNLYFKEEDK